MSGRVLPNAFQPRDELDDQQRVAAEKEEVIGHPDGPDPRTSSHISTSRACEARRGRRVRTRVPGEEGQSDEVPEAPRRSTLPLASHGQPARPRTKAEGTMYRRSRSARYWSKDVRRERARRLAGRQVGDQVPVRAVCSPPRHDRDIADTWVPAEHMLSTSPSSIRYRPGSSPGGRGVPGTPGCRPGGTARGRRSRTDARRRSLAERDRARSARPSSPGDLGNRVRLRLRRCRVPPARRRAPSSPCRPRDIEPGIRDRPADRHRSRSARRRARPRRRSTPPRSPSARTR